MSTFVYENILIQIEGFQVTFVIYHIFIAKTHNLNPKGKKYNHFVLWNMFKLRNCVFLWLFKMSSQ